MILNPPYKSARSLIGGTQDWDTLIEQSPTYIYIILLGVHMYIALKYLFMERAVLVQTTKNMVQSA